MLYLEAIFWRVSPDAIVYSIFPGIMRWEKRRDMLTAPSSFSISFAKVGF